MTDGHKKAGDPRSFLACCESIINGDFSSYRPIPCREEQQQSLIQKASIPAEGLGKAGNRQRRADGASGSGTEDGVSEEQPAALTDPGSPLRYTAGAAARTAFCIPAALVIGKYSNGKPDSAAKNSRIYSTATCESHC